MVEVPEAQAAEAQLSDPEDLDFALDLIQCPAGQEQCSSAGLIMSTTGGKL